MVVVIGAGVCLALSLLLPALLRPLLHRVGVVDVPNGRSSHTTPTLRGAGLAVLVALVAAFIVVLLMRDPSVDAGAILLVLVVSVAAGLLGFCEDVWGVPVAVRAGIQLVLGVGGAVAAASLFGLDWWWVALFGVGVAGYINVANFMDGINGISSLHGGVVGVALAVLGAITGELWLVVAGVLIAVAFIGFLPWNFAGRGMFLGDVGSYLLGASIAITMTVAFARGAPLLALIAPVSIYLADAGVTLLRRVLRGERWYEAHRSHIYQQLASVGGAHAPVGMLVAAFSMASAAAGLLALTGLVGTIIGAGLVIVLVLVYFSLPRLMAGSGSEEIEVPDSALPEGAVMDGPLRWAVVGATGFIGSAVVLALETDGISVIKVKAPRLNAANSDFTSDVRQLSELLSGIDVVVNAAGLAAPDSGRSELLSGANSVLPVVLAMASDRAGVSRLVHLSSAAVQGRRKTLDETATVAPFSAYSQSKARGETALLDRISSAAGSAAEIVIVRATSVQGSGRATTENLRRLAQSRLASVAGRGEQPTVVSSLRGLVDFIIFVGSYPDSVPTIVLQPWEGTTTANVLEHFGGRKPWSLPVVICRSIVAVGFAAGVLVPKLRGYTRRLEIMWFGQRQDAGWARSVGLEDSPKFGDLA